MPELIVHDIHLHYGSLHVLKGASFEVERGEIAALLGPSGCGKTTLLRSIAGLERASKGRVEIAGKKVFDSESGLDLPVEKRGLGFVFQSYALWPNKTVFDNVAYGLRLRKTPSADIKIKVERVLEALGLVHLLHRYPGQLSGGQQQRVAIARSMVYDPVIILLDEPLSNLDAKLRDEARVFLKELIKKEERSAVIVTHDQIEALAIADIIVLLNGGIIEQAGSPETLYKQPKTMFTADFIGSNIKLAGRIEAISRDIAVIDCGGLKITGRLMSGKEVGSDAVAVCRLERIGIGGKDEEDCFAMQRSTSMFLGERWENLYRSHQFDIRVFTDEHIKEDISYIHIPRQDVWVF